MEKYGEVKAIVNDEMLLVSSSNEFIGEETVDVFSQIEDERLLDLIGKNSLFIPKGEIQIICKQTEGIYLAKRFRDFEERIRKVTKPNPFLSGLSSLSTIASQFQGETREEVDRIPGEWSAKFDSEQNLKITPSDIIKIGDLVGRV